MHGSNCSHQRWVHFNINTLVAASQIDRSNTVVKIVSCFLYTMSQKSNQTSSDPLARKTQSELSRS